MDDFDQLLAQYHAYEGKIIHVEKKYSQAYYDVLHKVKFLYNTEQINKKQFDNMLTYKINNTYCRLKNRKEVKYTSYGYIATYFTSRGLLKSWQWLREKDMENFKLDYMQQKDFQDYLAARI